MKLNTNSNTYILAYASLLVIAVAFVLAYFSQALKPIQDKNVALDKKKQIIFIFHQLVLNYILIHLLVKLILQQETYIMNLK